MLKLLIILGILNIQLNGSFGLEDTNDDKKSAIEKEIKLDDKPYGIAETIKNAKELVEGQRQKRFFNYIGYSTGASSFSSILPNTPYYASNDILHGTNIPNEQNKLSDILKRLRNLAEITRPQYLPPHHNAHYPFFIPISFNVPSGCTCPQTNANNPTSIPQPAPQTPPETTYLPPINGDTNKTKNKTMPNFGNRVGGDETSKTPNTDFSDDYDDGVRPINFDALPPEVPLNVVPPPVEHGSFQAGLDPSPPGLNLSPALASPGNKIEDVSPQASMPTICDGAILLCCHRRVVTLDCFAKEGCGELNDENPCESGVLSKIVNKFRAYIKKRGS